jgi:hypothetical protein
MRRTAHVILKAMMVSTLLAAGMCITSHAQDAAEQRAEEFKAAYLFNFVKFVEWPDAVVTDTLNVCFIGGETVYQAFVTGIETKRAGSRRLTAQRLSPSDSLKGCHALYLDTPANSSDARLRALAELPILTVSDAKFFADQGGIIEVFAAKNRLRFIISVESAQRAGLRISARLLQLSATERDDAP